MAIFSFWIQGNKKRQPPMIDMSRYPESIADEQKYPEVYSELRREFMLAGVMREVR